MCKSLNFSFSIICQLQPMWEDNVSICIVDSVSMSLIAITCFCLLLLSPVLSYHVQIRNDFRCPCVEKTKTNYGSSLWVFIITKQMKYNTITARKTIISLKICSEWCLITTNKTYISFHHIVFTFNTKYAWDEMIKSTTS